MREREEVKGPLPGSPQLTLRDWKDKLFQHLEDREPQALAAVLPALNAHPNDPQILLMAVIAALFDEKPEQALRYLQRFTKRFVPLGLEDQLLKVVALA